MFKHCKVFSRMPIHSSDSRDLGRFGILWHPPYKTSIPTNKVFYWSATLTLWEKHLLCCCNLLLLVCFHLGWDPLGGWAMCESQGDTRLCAEWNTLTPGLAANRAAKETRVEGTRVPGNGFQNKAHFGGSEQAKEIHIYLLHFFSSYFFQFIFPIYEMYKY